MAMADAPWYWVRAQWTSPAHLVVLALCGLAASAANDSPLTAVAVILGLALVYAFVRAMKNWLIIVVCIAVGLIPVVGVIALMLLLAKPQRLLESTDYRVQERSPAAYPLQGKRLAILSRREASSGRMTPEAAQAALLRPPYERPYRGTLLWRQAADAAVGR